MIKLILFNLIVVLVINSVSSGKYYQFCIKELSDNDKFRSWFEETCQAYGILSFLEEYRSMKPVPSMNERRQIQSRSAASHYEQLKDDIANCCLEPITCLHNFRRWDYLCLIDPLVERGVLHDTHPGSEPNDDKP